MQNPKTFWLSLVTLITMLTIMVISIMSAVSLKKVEPPPQVGVSDPIKNAVLVFTWSAVLSGIASVLMLFVMWYAYYGVHTLRQGWANVARSMGLKRGEEY